MLISLDSIQNCSSDGVRAFSKKKGASKKIFSKSISEIPIWDKMSATKYFYLNPGASELMDGKALNGRASCRIGKNLENG